MPGFAILRAMRRLLVTLSVLAVPVCASAVESAGAYHFTLAKILVDQGKYREAGENFEAALDEVADDPFLRVEYAEFLLNGGRTTRALEQLAVARGLSPSDPQIAKAYGELQLQAAREDESAFVEARRAFEQLRLLTPEDPEAMSTLGRIYLSEDRFAEAAEVFAEALTYWPRSRGLHGSRIDALLRSGDNEAAHDALVEFLEVDPASLRARLTLVDLKESQDDEEGAREVLLSTPRDSSGDGEMFRRLAVGLYEARAFDEALYWLDRSLDQAEDGPQPQTLFLRALLLTATDRNAEARSELEALLVLEPQRRDALELLVRHQLEAELWQEALTRLAPMLEDDSAGGEGLEERAELVMLYADALVGDDRAEEALDWLSRLSRFEGVGRRAVARQAGLLFTLDRAADADRLLDDLTADGAPQNLLLAAEVCQRNEEYERAIPWLEQALDGGDEPLQALFWLGAAYERTGRIADAEEQFLRFLDIEPDSAPVLNYLGYMWADHDINLAQALVYVERAVALDPDNGAYVDSLGWAHYRLGNFEEARGHLERAAGLVGDDAVVLEHLGDVYSALGETDDALRLYRQALDLEGENAAEIEKKLQHLDRP